MGGSTGEVFDFFFFSVLYLKSVDSGSCSWADGREVNREAEFGNQVGVLGGSEHVSGICWALITHTGECECVCVCVRMGEGIPVLRVCVM